jgi:hypothetical protein
MRSRVAWLTSHQVVDTTSDLRQISRTLLPAPSRHALELGVMEGPRLDAKSRAPPVERCVKAAAAMACDDGVLPLQSRLAGLAEETELDDAYDTKRHRYLCCLHPGAGLPADSGGGQHPSSFKT